MDKSKDKRKSSKIMESFASLKRSVRNVGLNISEFLQRRSPSPRNISDPKKAKDEDEPTGSNVSQSVGDIEKTQLPSTSSDPQILYSASTSSEGVTSDIVRRSIDISTATLNYLIKEKKMRVSSPYHHSEESSHDSLSDVTNISTDTTNPLKRNVSQSISDMEKIALISTSGSSPISHAASTSGEELTSDRPDISTNLSRSIKKRKVPLLSAHYQSGESSQDTLLDVTSLSTDTSSGSKRPQARRSARLAEKKSPLYHVYLVKSQKTSRPSDTSKTLDSPQVRRSILLGEKKSSQPVIYLVKPPKTSLSPDTSSEIVDSPQVRRSMRLAKKKASLHPISLFELRKTLDSSSNLPKDVCSKEVNEFIQHYFTMVDGSTSGLEDILAEDVTLDYFGTVIQGKRLVLQKLTEQNLIRLIAGPPIMTKVSADLKYSPIYDFNVQLFEHKTDKRGSKLNIDTTYKEESALINKPMLISYNGNVRTGFKYVQVQGTIHCKKIEEKSSESESSSDSTGSWSENCSLLFLYTEEPGCDQLPSTSRQIQSKYKIHVIKYYRN